MVTYFRAALLAALPLFAWPKADEAAFFFINDVRHPVLDAVSTVSSELVYAPQVLFAYSLGYGHYADERAARRFGALGLTVSAADVAVTQALKGMFRRPRPKIALEAAQGGYAHGFFAYLIPTEKYSSPSQSASLTAAEAIVLGRAFPRYDLYFGLLCLLSGWAKIYEGAHYPLDILAGTAVGAGVAYASMALLKPAGWRVEPGRLRLPLLAFETHF